MEKLEDVIFYIMDKSMKVYRQHSQKKLVEAGHTITIDQWLVLTILGSNRNLSQNDIATKVFKDTASITRIIELMVKAGYLKRTIHSKDRRRMDIGLTKKGEIELKAVKPIILNNRKIALQGISKMELTLLNTLLKKITSNCKIEENKDNKITANILH